MDKQVLESALGEYFAPWVQALGLRVEAFDADSVTLRLPQNAQLSRVGGMLCGQARQLLPTLIIIERRKLYPGFRPMVIAE